MKNFNFKSNDAGFGKKSEGRIFNFSKAIGKWKISIFTLIVTLR